MTRALVVGRGSIGARHARILTTLGCDVGYVSRREAAESRVFREIETGLVRFEPDYVVLARETSTHLADLATLAGAGYEGRVLVEKPLSLVAAEVPVHNFAKFAVAYNLRFHPLVERLREELEGSTAISADIYAGQHLAKWRPGTDLRSTYSADASRGGGVLRDLSHELDYIQWILGDWRRVCASGGNSGALPIDSDDHWGVLLTTERCSMVTLHLNYLDHIGQRTITINMKDSTIHVDLNQGAFSFNEHRFQIPIARDLTYQRQHEAMLFDRDEDLLCSAEEGRQTMALIDAIERSDRDARWVVRR